MIYEFDRYRRIWPGGGPQLMAEDIRISHATDLDDAWSRARRLADRGDVLVLRTQEDRS
jgi:hypothetical protein